MPDLSNTPTLPIPSGLGRPQSSKRAASDSRKSQKQAAVKPKRDMLSVFLRAITYLAAFLGFSIMALLVLYILIKGVPYLSGSLFAWTYTTDNLSMIPALVNTVLVVLATLALSIPLGIGAAIYLQEYVKKNSRFVRLVSIMAQTLAGIPSIVYGLFGLLFFVGSLQLGLSLISGILTLTIMVLPLIMQTAQEALEEIPDSMREASFALGAGKLRTVFSVLLPQAAPGIFAGILLATGRIIGESAALIFTSGTIAKAAFNLLDPGATLSVHMYKLLNEGLYMDQAGAVAVVLLGLTLLINLCQSQICKRMMKGAGS